MYIQPAPPNNDTLAQCIVFSCEGWRKKPDLNPTLGQLKTYTSALCCFLDQLPTITIIHIRKSLIGSKLLNQMLKTFILHVQRMGSLNTLKMKFPAHLWSAWGWQLVFNKTYINYSSIIQKGVYLTYYQKY
jgi:hypothetical protein